MANNTGVVVVGVDGSPDSMTALSWAEQQVRATGAKLRIVTTWAWPVSYGSLVTYDGYLPDIDALSVTEKAKSGLTLPASRIETVCREGSPGVVLVAEAEDADLLVVGSHGHSQLGSMLLGSVSNYCVHHAPCPVVVAR